MWKLGIILVCLAATLTGAQPDYFPLQVGNQWSYRTSRLGQPFTLVVTGTQDAGGQTYFVVQGFATGVVWMRMADDGTLYAYDPDAKTESVWAAFGSPEGQTYSTSIGPCNETARISSKGATLELPIGHFENGLTIEYPPAQCADAGLTSEAYLPNIGLVRREATSFAGPVVYDLAYARLNGGLTYVSAPEQGFTVALDNLVYPAGGNVTARLTIRNTQSQPLVLTFPNGQRYDVVVRDAKGAVVYQWSRGKLFIQMVGSIAVNGEQTWLVPFTAPDAAGKYTVEAWLASDPPADRGQVAMEVK